MIIFNGITIIKHRPWLQANEARDESSWGNDKESPNDSLLPTIQLSFINQSVFISQTI